MIKKHTVKLIGIALIVLGFSYVYSGILQATGLTTNTFVSTFLNLLFGGIAIYGGINLVRLQEVGRKVSVICFAWILLQIAITQLPKFWSGESPFLAPLNVKYLVVIICGYALYTSALILLLDNKAIEIMNYDDRIMQKTGIILAYCAPGLGRALTNNFFIGMGLFFGYQLILAVVFSQQDLTTTIPASLGIWLFFSFIDRAAVKKAFEVEQAESDMIENEPEKNRG